MRRPILAANWKMQKITGEAEAFVRAFLPLVLSSGMAPGAAKLGASDQPLFERVELVIERLEQAFGARTATHFIHSLFGLLAHVADLSHHVHRLGQLVSDSN